MTIWVDADSCPPRVRDIVARAALRTGNAAVFVANRRIPLAVRGPFVESVIVDAGRTADDFIVSQARRGDLVVTRDIPLAAQLVAIGMRVLNDRGDVYSTENVRERLSVRDFMQDLRAAGIHESPRRSAGLGPRELSAFARAFDAELTRALRADP